MVNIDNGQGGGDGHRDSIEDAWEQLKSVHYWWCDFAILFTFSLQNVRSTMVNVFVLDVKTFTGFLQVLLNIV